MAFSLVTSTVLRPGISSGTSSSIDTTGAKLIIIGASTYQNNAFTLIDSKYNTWTALTNRFSTNASHRFYYCAFPYVGTGHTFTITGTSIYSTVYIYAFSTPYAAFDVQNGATAAASTGPLSTGSVTPTINGALVITGFAVHLGTTIVPPGTFTTTSHDHVASTSMGAGFGYYVQPTAASISSSWDWSTSGTSAANIAAFVEPSASAGGRVTQIVAEMLGTQEAGNIRVTQVVVEVLGSTVGVVSAEKSYIFLDDLLVM